MYSIIKLHALQFGVHSEQWVGHVYVTNIISILSILRARNSCCAALKNDNYLLFAVRGDLGQRMGAPPREWLASLHEVATPNAAITTPTILFCLHDYEA